MISSFLAETWGTKGGTIFGEKIRGHNEFEMFMRCVDMSGRQLDMQIKSCNLGWRKKGC